MKSSDNRPWILYPTMDTANVENYIYNQVGDVTFEDSIVPKNGSTYNMGSGSKFWGQSFIDLPIVNADANYVLVPDFTKQYLGTGPSADTLQPFPVDDPFPINLNIASNFNYYGGIDGDGNTLLRFPTRGLYLISFDMTYNTDLLPFPAGNCTFKMTDMTPPVPANRRVLLSSKQVAFFATIPVLDIPIPIAVNPPIEYSIFWSCININERIKLTFQSDLPVMGVALATTIPEPGIALFFKNIVISRLVGAL